MMNFLLSAVRCSFIALSFLAASCTATSAPQGSNSTGSDDNGAFCAGTPANKKRCEDNQSRMADPD
jgi:hypothetical protein